MRGGEEPVGTGSAEAARPTTPLVYRAPTATQPELFQPEAAMGAELAQFEGASGWA